MGILKTFTGSFHSAELYRHARANGKFGLGYALMLVLATTLIVTLYFGIFMHREFFAARDGKPALFDDVVRQISNQVPVMTLHDNELQTREPMPTTIVISGTAFGETFENVPVLTIDTSGTADYEKIETPFLITNKDIYIKSSDKTEIKSLSEITKDQRGTLVINRAVALEAGEDVIAFIHKNLATFYLVIGSLCWLGIAIVMYIMRIFMLFTLGLVGLAIGGITNSPITYPAAVMLASVSYTPVALLDTFLYAAFSYHTNWITLLFAGSVALFAAIKCSNPPPPRQLVG